MLDLERLPHVVAEHLGNKPHPDVPELKVNQYTAFARAAARMFEAEKPTPQHVQIAFHALVNAGIAPGEFERLWDASRPLANTLLKRDPNLHDFMQLVGHPPAAIQAYYQSHPHPEAPDVPAGTMAAYHANAAPLSQVLHGRDPNHVELRRFALGNYGIEDMLAHYLDDGSSLRQKR